MDVLSDSLTACHGWFRRDLWLLQLPGRNDLDFGGRDYCVFNNIITFQREPLIELCHAGQRPRTVKSSFDQEIVDAFYTNTERSSLEFSFSDNRKI